MVSQFVLASQQIDRYSFVQFFFAERVKFTVLLLADWIIQLPVQVVASLTCSKEVPSLVLIIDWILVLLEMLYTVLSLIAIAAYLKKKCIDKRRHRQKPFKLTETNLRLGLKLCKGLKNGDACEREFLELMGPHSSVNQRLSGIEIGMYLRTHSWATGSSFEALEYTAENRSCAACDSDILAREHVCVTACCNCIHHVYCFAVCCASSAFCPLCKSSLRSSLIQSISRSLAQGKPIDPVSYVK